MTPRLNATVRSGYMARDGRMMHWIRYDKTGETVLVAHDRALDEGVRVRLDRGRIEAVG